MVSMGSPAGPCALCHCVRRGEDVPVPAAGCLCGSDVASPPLLRRCWAVAEWSWGDGETPPAPRWGCFKPTSQRWKTSQGTAKCSEGPSCRPGMAPPSRLFPAGGHSRLCGASVSAGPRPSRAPPRRSRALRSQSLPRASCLPQAGLSVLPGSTRSSGGSGRAEGAPAVAPGGDGSLWHRSAGSCRRERAPGGSAGLRAGRARQAPARCTEGVLGQTSQTLLFYFKGLGFAG